MKVKMLLLIFFIFPSILFGNDVIVFNYLDNVMKISYDGGTNWIIKQKYGPVVEFEYINGNAKISYDYGKTWTKIFRKSAIDKKNNFALLIDRENVFDIPIDSNSPFLISLYDVSGKLVRKYYFENSSSAQIKVMSIYLCKK